MGTEQLIASNQTQLSQPVSPVSPAVTNTYGANTNMSTNVANANTYGANANMTYAAPSTTMPQGVAPAQNMTYAAPPTTIPQRVAPAQNMTYAAPSTMAPPQSVSGGFAQGVAPGQNN